MNAADIIAALAGPGWASIVGPIQTVVLVFVVRWIWTADRALMLMSDRLDHLADGGVEPLSSRRHALASRRGGTGD